MNGCIMCDYILVEGDMQLSYILVYDILFGFDFAGMVCAWAQTFLATMSCIGCATSHWDSLWGFCIYAFCFRDCISDRIFSGLFTIGVFTVDYTYR